MKYLTSLLLVATAATAVGVIRTSRGGEPAKHVTPASGDDKPGTIDFRVHVEGKRKGTVLCALYDNPTDWLSKNVVAGASVTVDSDSVTCVFKNVQKHGSYGIAAFHDENGNGELDKTLGIPQEGYGMSRDAQNKGLLPTWENAVFEFTGGENVQTASMKY